MQYKFLTDGTLESWWFMESS